MSLNFPVNWFGFNDDTIEGYTNPSFLPGTQRDDTKALHKGPVYDSNGKENGHHSSFLRMRTDTVPEVMDAEVIHKDKNGIVTTHKASYPIPFPLASASAAPVLIGSAYSKPASSTDPVEAEKTKKKSLFNIPINPIGGLFPYPFAMSIEDAPTR